MATMESSWWQEDMAWSGAWSIKREIPCSLFLKSLQTMARRAGVCLLYVQRMVVVWRGWPKTSLRLIQINWLEQTVRIKNLHFTRNWKMADENKVYTSRWEMYRGRFYPLALATINGCYHSVCLCLPDITPHIWPPICCFLGITKISFFYWGSQ